MNQHQYWRRKRLIEPRPIPELEAEPREGSVNKMKLFDSFPKEIREAIADNWSSVQLMRAVREKLKRGQKIKTIVAFIIDRNNTVNVSEADRESANAFLKGLGL